MRAHTHGGIRKQMHTHKDRQRQYNVTITLFPILFLDIKFLISNFLPPIQLSSPPPPPFHLLRLRSSSPRPFSSSRFPLPFFSFPRPLSPTPPSLSLSSPSLAPFLLLLLPSPFLHFPCLLFFLLLLPSPFLLTLDPSPFPLRRFLVLFFLREGKPIELTA